MSEPQNTASPRWVRWWVACLTLSAFGPYLGSGIRTEQLAVYGSLAMVCLGVGLRPRRSGTAAIPFILLWGSYVAIAVFSVAFPVVADMARGGVVGGLDNVLAPLAMLFVAWCWSGVGRGDDLVLVAARTVVAATTVNGVLAIISMLRGGVLPLPWLSVFWGSSAESSVAIRAAANGRYSGIFNQPAEAGIAYSIAAFCLLYLVQRSHRRGAILFVGVGAILAVGGLLTASKIFLFGGVPAIAYLVIRDRVRRKQIAVLTAMLAVAGYLAGGAGVLTSWSGLSMLTSIFDSDSFGVGSLTAGRFGESSTLEGPAQAVLQHSPIVGFGAGGLAVPYDSMWLEALVMAGIVGVALITVLFALLGIRFFSIWRGRMHTPEALLGGAVVVLTAGASFGMPALTGNRVSTIVWIFLGMLIVTRSKDSGPERGGAIGSVAPPAAWIRRPGRMAG